MAVVCATCSDGFDVWETIAKGSPSPRTEILHLIDPLGNALAPNAAGCELSGLAGPCANSSAIRKGNYKLIVGMWAMCSKNNGSMDVRQCGWWDPDAPAPPPPPIPAACAAALGALCGSVRTNSTACMACLTEHSEALGAAGCTAPAAESYCGPEREHNPRDTTYRTGDSYEHTASARFDEPFDTADPPVALFDVIKDPNEHNDLSETLPDVVSTLKMRIDELYAEMTAGGTTGKMPRKTPAALSPLHLVMPYKPHWRAL